MTCIELHDTGTNTVTLKSKDWLPVAFNKIPDTPLMKPSPVSERSAYPLQNMHAFLCSPLGYKVLATNLLPLTGPGLRPPVQNSS